ncbi:pyrroline-5-carboxylate reductase [Collinsella provencensis]|uniref:pyrroline-5-carboxylate reductase n=1 Tax=Collinsella provencensis TaxID=1937461 RepID=UPI000C83242E|nr:pyrroline-5-carboxylate reductase [Collinsella provencensis]
MELKDVKIGFIGFGNMASAMADGWLASNEIAGEQMYACSGSYERLLERTEWRNMHACKDAAELVGKVDLVVVAIKPYMIEPVLTPIADALANVPFISVAAGWDCAEFDKVLPGTRHVSTIPNTPVSIDEGVIACENISTLGEDERVLVHELLGLLGTVVEVETKLLSVAGTVGGCSPAFIAMVIEALGDAAVKYGIPRAQAYKMVSQMVAGTAKLQLASGVHPGVMKDAVCSPGGTTIKGVAELEAAGMRSAFIRAIDVIEG